MEPYQNRIVAEKRELDGRLGALIAFIRTDVFETLPEAERDRMQRQSVLMLGYSDVLAERIEAFDAEQWFGDHRADSVRTVSDPARQ